MASDPGNAAITFLLERLKNGHEEARDELFELVYLRLRRIAAKQMRHERDGHTLQPTALVHEAYLRLVGRAEDFQNTAHFFAVAAQAMRFLLVDHARRRLATKRGAGLLVDLPEEAWAASPAEPDLVLSLDEALTRLTKLDERKCRIVEMKFFAGLTEEQIAKALGISLRTVKRDWAFAKAWLYEQMA